MLRSLVDFSDALIYLSYPAKLVALDGNAPSSSAYQAGALLLSYRADYEIGGRHRTRPCTPFKGLTVLPSATDSGFAYLYSLFEMPFKTDAARPIILGLTFRLKYF